MLGVLHHLGLNPVKFVRRALDHEGGWELDVPQGDAPKVVKKARDRVAAGLEGAGLGEAFLRTLDEQRNREPGRAVALAEWAVDHVELALLPRLLGVLGSAYRLQFRLNEAEHSIFAGIEICLGMDGDPFLISSLFTRLSYVVSNQGDRQSALELAERAALLSLRNGDSDGAGRALVAQGIWLYYLDRVGEGIQTLESALQFLSTESRRNRFAALQCLGFSYQKTGDLEGALSKVDASQDVLPEGDGWAEGKLLWLRGRIYADLKELDQAASAMEGVVAIFWDLHFGEAALATCELIRIRLKQGYVEESLSLASSMRALVEPLRHNMIISAAIVDLLRSGRQGLTLTLVRQVMSQIEGERKKSHSWNVLGAKP